MKTNLLTTWKAAKKIAFSFLLTGLVHFTATAQTWGDQASGLTTGINGIYFAEESNTGYAVGMEGRILKTINGGITWSLLNSGIVKNLYGISFYSNGTGFAVGDSGIVLMTTDEGDSWDTLTRVTYERLNSVHMKGSVGFAVGNNGTVIRINSNGLSLSNSNTTSNLFGVFVLDDQTAFAAGGGLLSSTLIATYNGGNVWIALSPGTLTQLNDVFFINDSTGYAVGNNGTIIKTTNYGTDWNSQTATSASNLRALYFVSKDTGYTVGATGTILRTTNGSTWTSLISGTTSTLNDVSFSDHFTGYAAGNAGTIQKTCPTVRFKADPNDSICVHGIIDFDNQGGNSTAHKWLVDDDTLGTNTNFSYRFDTAGNYDVTLIADNGTCTASLSMGIFVADTPSVNLGHDTTICNTCTITLDAGNIGSTYIWHKDGNPTGVVSRTNTVGISGTYSVQVTNPSGCIAWDSVEVTIATSVNDISGNIRNLKLYPNPANRQFTLDFVVEQKQHTEITITNFLGAVVYSKNIPDLAGWYSEQISLEHMAPGMYMVNISAGHEKTKSMKLITY